MSGRGGNLYSEDICHVCDKGHAKCHDKCHCMRNSFLTSLVLLLFSRVFAFVARRAPSSMDNVCHIFCELEQTQPATAIVSFANNAVLNVTANGAPPASPRIL